MKTQKYKILDVNKSQEGVEFDIRINVSSEHCTPEFIEDMISSKDHFVNGITILLEDNKILKKEFTLRLNPNDIYDEIIIQCDVSET